VLRHAVACALVRYRRERRDRHEPNVRACTFPALLAFSRELVLSLRRHPAGTEFSPHTRRLVQRWFERGLSGRLMWLVAEGILHRGARETE